MSGMMLMRAVRRNLRGWITSAVPSQLLPTYSTSRSTGARLRFAASAAAGTSASPRPATASTAMGTTARRIIVTVCLPALRCGYARDAVPDRVEMLRPIGNPLPLGFLGLAGGTLIVSGLQLGWLDQSQGTQVALMLIAFVFPLQLLTSIFGYL